MWPFTSSKKTDDNQPYRTSGKPLDTSITPYSEFGCNPTKADLKPYTPPPVEDTSTAKEKVQQHGSWVLVFGHSAYFHSETKLVDARWKVVVYVQGEKRDLFLTEKDMAHLATILEPENRKPWTKDGMFGFEREGMKFYVQSYMAPLVLKALKECKRDNNIP